MKKQVMVTGGGGFIGSHLVERLLADGADVTVVDTFRFAYPDNLDTAKQLARACLEIREENVADGDWRVRGQYDEIYHLAGLAGTADFVAHPRLAFWTSVRAMERIMQYVQETGARALFASSSEVYGDATVVPQHEDYRGNVSFTGPRSGYDEGKRAGETLIAAWQRETGAGAAIARIFNTYGPRMPATGRLVAAMAADALHLGEIVILGTGRQKRSLLYVDDCVEALIGLMALQLQRPVNVGSPRRVSVLEVAGMVADAVVRVTGGPRPALRTVPAAPDDVMDRQPDIDRIRSLMGWQPRTSLGQGIEETVRYWQNRPHPDPDRTWLSRILGNR